MSQIITIFHVLLGLGIIGLILIQQGKGADAGASFGSGSSGSVFGAQGAGNFLTRSTAILATLFFLTSLGLAMLAGSTRSTNTDLMSVESEKKESVQIPQLDSKTEALPQPTAPEVKPEALPTTETAPAIPAPAEVAAEQPKPAEPTKPAEDAQPAIVPTDSTQPIAKEAEKLQEPTKADASKSQSSASSEHKEPNKKLAPKIKKLTPKNTKEKSKKSEKSKS